MSSNVYSTGLRYVGSYQVSGIPFVTKKSVNSGDEIKIEFPYVTKKIKVKIVPRSSNSTIMEETGGGLGAWWWSFATNKSGNSNFSGAGNLPLFGSSSVPSENADYTHSYWFKIPSSNAGEVICTYVNGIQRVNSKTGVSDAHSSMLLVGTSSFNRVLYVIGSPSTHPGRNTLPENNVSTEITVPDIRTNWNHILITQHTSSTHVYINGVSVFDTPFLSMTASSAQWGFNSAGKVPAQALYDESCFWNTGMTAEEAAAVFNNGEWVDPNYLSTADNLVGWWTWGDDGDGVYAPGITADSTGNVFINRATGSASVTNATLGLYRKNFGETIEYTDSPFEKQSVGKLRVHLLSTGSTSGANIISNKHYQELQGYGTSIEIPAKTKEIYLTAVDSQVTFEITAELTNIPTGSMYNLTGSGIDE